MSLGTFQTQLADVVMPESEGQGRQVWRSNHAHEEGFLLDAATGLAMP